MRMETRDMDQDKIKLFEDQPIRTAWDEEHEEWYFSIVDVIAPLTMSLGLRRHGSRCIFV
jgi:hypothetical protein